MKTACLLEIPALIILFIVVGMVAPHLSFRETGFICLGIVTYGLLKIFQGRAILRG